jgi:hypothetical protein
MKARVKGLENVKQKASQRKRTPARDLRPKQADPPKTVDLVAPKASQKTIDPPPTPKTSVHLDFGSTDFTSLFAASDSLSDAPSSTGTKTTTTDAASRRVQLALELHGGDYSKLIPNGLVNSQGDPLVYATSTMARRKDLGPNGRNNALEIVRGMIGKSLGSQPTL